MEIAPNFTDCQWKQLSFKNERDWIRGVAALRRRLRHRFLKPARNLLRSKRSGFAVLALDCLLIETLQQFREGVPQTPYVRKPNGHRVLASEDYFIAFLTSQYFDAQCDENMAKLFYQTIRCGILHQAEVKESSLVRRDRPLISLSLDQKGVVVNPVLFHKRVEIAFQKYLVDLRNPAEANLRQRFRKKMNHIARVQAGV